MPARPIVFQYPEEPQNQKLTRNKRHCPCQKRKGPTSTHYQTDLFG
jgi:hypothetical protein